MMGQRAPARSGMEYDAISRWRHRRNWQHVRRSWWKRRLRRRERREAKQLSRRKFVL
jgi:hypothetical protein